MKRPDKQQLCELYAKMVRVRIVEQKLMDVFFNGEILGFIHVSIGQEAAPAGVCIHLKDTDYITTTHRGHGWAVAKGINLKRAMAELYGKKEGFCLGRAGSMHLADTAIGIMGSNGIVGGGIPIATGAAFAAHYSKTDQVAIATFGEGATSGGAFHESLNFAAIKKLPIVYVCENNSWAEFSPKSIHLPIESVISRARAYDIEAISVSNNVLEVFDAAGDAIKKARKGEGPTLLEVKSDRWYGHYVGDPQKYRSKDSVEEAMGKDCVLNYEQELIKNKILKKQDLENIKSQVYSEVEEAIAFARECSFPDKSEMFDGLYV
jgi:pyruvate dehydrogenase E1 component alpha subunit